MSFCPNCGRPCVACSNEAESFNLLSLPKDIRHLITVVLKKMNLNNETDQSILIKGLVPYKGKPLFISNALKEYLVMKNPPRSIPYLVAIVKGKSISKPDRLNALPPLMKEEEDI